jgi:hypothetical protein
MALDIVINCEYLATREKKTVTDNEIVEDNEMVEDIKEDTVNDTISLIEFLLDKTNKTKQKSIQSFS